MNFIKRQSPGLVITSGFAIVIFIGALLLLLPCSVKDGATVTFVDALFTSTSAVCVTGLIAIDTADHFTAIGQAVVALLIQIGGLGVTSVGVGVMIAVGHRVSYRSRYTSPAPRGSSFLLPIPASVPYLSGRFP